MRSLSSHSFLPLSVSVRRVLFAYLSPHFPLSWKTKEGTRKGVTRRRRSRNVHTVQTEPAVSEKKMFSTAIEKDGRTGNECRAIYFGRRNPIQFRTLFFSRLACSSRSCWQRNLSRWFFFNSICQQNSFLSLRSKWK